MLIWQVWIDRARERFRFCSDCQRIIYNCTDRRRISWQDDRWLIRDICESCDGFPFCDKVEYLRTSKPEDLFLGDLDGVYGNGDL